MSLSQRSAICHVFTKCMVTVLAMYTSFCFANHIEADLLGCKSNLTPRKISFATWSNDATGPTLLLPIIQNSGGLLLGKQSASQLLEDPVFKSVNRTASGPVRMLVLANRLGHMLSNDPFPFVRQKLRRYGAIVHILPVRIDLLLDESERRAMHQFIRNYYDGLIAIGGADIDPNMFGDARSVFLGSIFPAIDRTELEILSEWSIHSSGTLFGICRGHQIIASMLGAKLKQDIVHESPTKVIHHAPAKADADQATHTNSAWHMIRLKDHKNSLFNATAKSRFMVNSRHHQAVEVFNFDIQALNARVIAQSDNTIEALQLGSNKGFTVQFHPEDMETEEGNRIMAEMVRLTENNQGR